MRAADQLIEGSSRFLSDLGASSLLLSFLLWKFSWKESWVQAGIVVIYLASSFSGGRMAGNMAGKRRFLWGHLLWNRVFGFILDHHLPQSSCRAVLPGRKTLAARSPVPFGGGMGGGNDGTRADKSGQNRTFFKTDF